MRTELQDQGFEEDKKIVAEGYRALGLESLATDVENENNYKHFKIYAECALKLLNRDRLWDQFDNILSRNLIWR